MTAPNHVAGGLLFAGFWASFWNINIFQKPLYIAVAIIASLLPDIDHPGSFIGRLFYPLAKRIHKIHGHRTITHSLLFLFCSTFFILIIETTLGMNIAYGVTFIYFFGLLSHLLLDMITIKGVALLYPFRKNQCVMPGRSEYRLRSGNSKSELNAFILFCTLNFLSINLYRQGFWFSYNNTFSTIEHVHFERANSPNFTLCKYVFINQGKIFKGLAPIVDSKASTLDLLIKDKIVHLDYVTPGLVLKSVNPVKTNYPFKYVSRSFYVVTDSVLNAFCRQHIVTGNIQSNESFILHFYKPGVNEQEETKSGLSQELEHATSVYIDPGRENMQRLMKYTKDSLAIAKQLAIKKQSLIQDRINFDRIHAEYFVLRRKEMQMRIQLKGIQDIAIKNSIEIELIKIINKLQFMQIPVFTENTVTLETIRLLNLQLEQNDLFIQFFNAQLSYLDVPAALLKICNN